MEMVRKLFLKSLNERLNASLKSIGGKKIRKMTSGLIDMSLKTGINPMPIPPSIKKREVGTFTLGATAKSAIDKVRRIMIMLYNAITLLKV